MPKRNRRTASDIWWRAVATNIADASAIGTEIEPMRQPMHLGVTGWLTVAIVVLMFSSAVLMWWLS